MIPLGFILAVFSFYQVHKILMLNKEIVDDNINRLANDIITLQKLNNLLILEVKSLQRKSYKHDKKRIENKKARDAKSIKLV